MEDIRVKFLSEKSVHNIVQEKWVPAVKEVYDFQHDMLIGTYLNNDFRKY